MMVPGILNQSGPLGSTPVLCTWLHTFDRDFSCPENAGGNQNYLSIGKRDSDTLWYISNEICGEHGHCTHPKLCISDQVKLQLHPRRCIPDRDLESKAVMSTQRVTPVALRTRSKASQQDTAPLIANQLRQFEWETNDLIQRLIKQADKHHMEIQKKIQMIYDQQFLLSGQQALIAFELQKELAAIKMQKRSKDAAIEEQLV